LHFETTRSRLVEVNFVTSRYWHNYYYIYITALFLTKISRTWAHNLLWVRSKLFCNVIWWRAAQTSWKEEYRNTAASILHCAVNTHAHSVNMECI